MEADCIKEEIYRYFGRSTDAPSKAAFYKQRKKLHKDALPCFPFWIRNLLTFWSSPPVSAMNTVDTVDE
jgi:hypothetical protein